MSGQRFCRKGLRRIFLLPLLSSFLLMPVITGALPNAVHAYEGDHYAWTYYLALHVGFTKRQAFQIASAAYAIDWDPDTGPMEATPGDAIIGANHPGLFGTKHPQIAAIWADFHAFSNEALASGCSLTTVEEALEGNLTGDFSTFDPTNPKRPAIRVVCPDEVKAKVEAERNGRKEALRGLALAERNPGPLLHYVQDYYPHFLYNNFRGHALAGHAPDFLSFNHSKAIRMTHDTVLELQKFRSSLGTFSSEPQSGSEPFLRQKPRTPDRNRISTVLARLIKINPKPFKWDTQNFNVEGPDRAAPSLGHSVVVIDEAILEDEREDRLQHWPEKIESFPLLPPKWYQYGYSPEGRIEQTDTGPVEKVKLEFLKEKFEMESNKQHPDYFKLRLNLRYKISGLANIIDGSGDAYLTPLPVIEKDEFSDQQTPLIRHTPRWNGEDHETVVREIERSRKDLESGNLVWKVSVQLYGYEPKEKEVRLGLCSDLTGSEWSTSDSYGQTVWKFKAGQPGQTAALSQPGASQSSEDLYTWTGPYDGKHLELTAGRIEYSAGNDITFTDKLSLDLNPTECDCMTGTFSEPTSLTTGNVQRIAFTRVGKQVECNKE